MPARRHLRAFAAALVLAGGLTVMAGPAAAERQRCTGSGHDLWPPFSVITGAGAVEGAAHEIMRTAMDRIDLDYREVYVGPWKRVFVSLEEGLIDMVVGTTLNEERARQFLFTDTMAFEDIAVYVRRGRDITINTWDDLIGLRGTRARGASFGSAFDVFAAEKLDLIEAAQPDDARRMVLAGRVDYGLAPLGSVRASLRDPRYGTWTDIVTPSLIRFPVKAAIRKDSPCAPHLPALNEALADMHEDGTITAIMDRHVKLMEAGAYFR